MYTEKSPLTGGQPTYQNPSRMYKKQVKQFQCLLCAAVLSLFAIALITAIVFSVDEDEIDSIINGNASLEGKLQAAPGAKPGKPPKPIKLYTSGTVIKGSATGGFEGEETSQIFDGSLPATIHLDSIIDPNSWSASADLTWSGVVLHNDTVKGTFSLPAKIMNGTEEIAKTFKGDFEITMAFKWSANLNIVIPNKVYHCKAVFIAAYKSSMDGDAGSIAQSTTKGATDPTVETCNVLFQGSFYEKSFFCYLTPWWCTDEKLFYWNGGLEFKITKPMPKPTEPPTPPSSPNALKLTSSELQALPEDGMSVYNGAKILGTVASGWVTILDDAGATQTIWNGEIPGTIALSMIQGLSKDMGGLTWSASVSSNSMRGTFKLLQKTASGTPKLLEGSFFFLLESDPTTSLTSVLESGVEYTSTLSFSENGAVFNGTQIIDFVSHNTSSPDSSGYKTPVIVSGKYDYISKTFMWDGRFQMIAMKITKNMNGITDALQPAGDTKPVLGSSAFDWKPFAGTPIGSKLIGKVVSGWLTVQDESGTRTIWNGEFPADINAPMFFNPTTNESDLSDEYGHGAVWSCSVFHSSLRGSFQLPQYTRFGLVKWLKGSFFFQLESDPSWSLYDAVYPGVNYNSPIHFRNSDQPYNGSKLIPFYSHGVETTGEGMGYIAPIVLLGKADKVSKAFSWDGRFEMVVKKMSKQPNGILKSTSDDPSGNDMPKPASEPMPALTNTLKAGDGSTVGSKLIGKVSSGWVTVQDDSGTHTIWNGEIPATINAPMFYNPTTNVSDLSDEYGHGAIWSCSVFHSSLRGSFQLPQYTKFGLVKWLKGTFFFQLDSDPSWSLYDAIYPGVNYNSPIHFRNSDQPYNGSKLIQFYSYGAWGAFEDLGYKAHIILLGKSDKLSKSFSWDGRFEMIVKKEFKNIDNETDKPTGTKDNMLQSVKQPPVLNKTPKEALVGAESSVVGSKLLGKVSSGWVTVTSDSGTQTIWNGELPAKISAPLFYNATTDMTELSDDYGHGAVWSCSLFHSTLKGSFQLPQYTKFGLVKWVKGNFFFQLESSPDWSLYDAVVPGINYYSPIHFRTAGKEFNETKLINLYSYGQPSPMDNLGFKAPILLLGQGQGKGKARSFTWDGRFLIVVKKFY